MKREFKKAHIFPDNVDTDVIIPARYLNLTEKTELAKHCMEDIAPDFVKKAEKGDVIVAGENFGCGSSREHAPLSIKTLGISVCIAKSFSRIFYRNAINIGLPICECKDADKIKENDVISVDFEIGIIYNETSGESYETVPFPPFIKEIIASGGLLESLKEQK